MIDTLPERPFMRYSTLVGWATQLSDFCGDCGDELQALLETRALGVRVNYAGDRTVVSYGRTDDVALLYAEDDRGIAVETDEHGRLVVDVERVASLVSFQRSAPDVPQRDHTSAGSLCLQLVAQFLVEVDRDQMPLPCIHGDFGLRTRRFKHLTIPIRQRKDGRVHSP